MAIKRKRTGLDALGLGAEKSVVVEEFAEKRIEPVEKPAKNKANAKNDIAKTTVYVPQAVFEQWRELAFTERKKMHDYLLEGLDRVFKDRGLRSIKSLTDE